MSKFHKDDPVITPSGRRGTVQVPDGNSTMPNHCLVHFPEQKGRVEDTIWQPAVILKLEEDSRDEAM